jgi:hypothetical protein
LETCAATGGKTRNPTLPVSNHWNGLYAVFAIPSSHCFRKTESLSPLRFGSKHWKKFPRFFQPLEPVIEREAPRVRGNEIEGVAKSCAK